MTDNNEFVFAALGGLGEIGMNCALYGYGPPKRAEMADGRSRRRFRRRRRGRDRSGHARRRLRREGEEGPGRHRHHPRARGPHRRARRRLAEPRRAGLRLAVLGRPRRGAASGRAGRAQGDARDRPARRPRPDRPVRRRVRARRPFDPGEFGAGDPDARRPRRPHRRLEDRSHSRDRLGHRRSPPQGARRRGRARRSCAIRPTSCAKARVRPSATSRRPSSTSSARRRAGWW